MTRSNFVLVWKLENLDGFYCSLCRVPYKGNVCPRDSMCQKYTKDPFAFDNTKHIIIATKTYCNAKQYGCDYNCSNCTITNTYPSVKVIIK